MWQSLPNFVRISLAKNLTMKICQASRTRSFQNLVNHRFYASRIVMSGRCTKIVTGQICTKRDLTTTATSTITVNIDELKAMISANDIQLIDVREPHELKESGTIPKSINVPLATIQDALKMNPEQFLENYNAKKPLQQDVNIVFHCKAGVRSKYALEMAHQLGFKKSKHFPGGFDEWEIFAKKGL